MHLRQREQLVQRLRGQTTWCSWRQTQQRPPEHSLCQMLKEDGWTHLGRRGEHSLCGIDFN